METIDCDLDPPNQIWAFLLFPVDGDKRDAFLAGTFGKALGQIMQESAPDDLASIDPKLVFDLGSASVGYDALIDHGLRPVKLRSGSRATNVFAGEFAAIMLLLPFVAFLQGKRIGRNKVYDVFCGTMNARRSLQSMWQRYQDVSHLWAAFIVFGTVPDNNDDLATFLSFAELLRQWAVAYVPHRNHEPLLPASAYHLTGDFLVPVELGLESVKIDPGILKTLDLDEPKGTVHFTREAIFLTGEK